MSDQRTRSRVVLCALAAACIAFLAVVFLRHAEVDGLSAGLDLPSKLEVTDADARLQAPDEDARPERKEAESTNEDSRRSIGPARPTLPTVVPDRKAFLDGRIDLRQGGAGDFTIHVAPSRNGDPNSVFAPRRGFREVALRDGDRSFASGAAIVVTHHVGAAPRFRIDVSSIVFDARTQALRIRVEQPHGYPHDFVVPTLGEHRTEHASGMVELKADLVLDGDCVAWGTVASPRPARVAAFALNDGLPDSTPSDDAEPFPSHGSYMLSLKCDRDHAVVAFAEGCRPSTRIVPAGFRGEISFTLDRGESISGVVRVGGGSVSGLVRLEAAEPASREVAPRCSVGGRWLVWNGAGFEWDSMSVVSDAEGRFEFTGLAPRGYTLSMGRVPGVYASDSPVSQVTAPASEVALTPRLCRLDLRLFQSGSPAANVSFGVWEVGPQRTTMGSHKTDEAGWAVLWVDPDRATTIEVSAQTSEDAPAIKSKHPVTCPGADQAFSMRIDY